MTLSEYQARINTGVSILWTPIANMQESQRGLDIAGGGIGKYARTPWHNPWKDDPEALPVDYEIIPYNADDTAEGQGWWLTARFEWEGKTYTKTWQGAGPWETGTDWQQVTPEEIP